MTQLRVRVIHETNPVKYFPALIDLAERGEIQLVGMHRYSVVKEWLRAGVKDRTSLSERTRNALGDARLRIQLPFLSGETIVLGFAPWDWRLVVYRVVARRNRVVLHTSWPNWARGEVPRSQGLLIGLRRRVWVRFLQHPSVTVVCVLPQISVELQTRFAVQSEVVPHAVPEYFFAQRREARDVGPLRLLYVGELSEKKGVPQLIELMSRLSGHDASLTIVGDGPLLASCRQAANNYPAITVHGPERDRKRLAELMGAHDLMLLLSQRQPTWQELFGIVTVESVAAGVAVVASSHIGPRAILGDVTPEALFADDDLSGVQNLVAACVDDHEQVRALAARQHPVAAEYRLSAIADRWLGVLQGRHSYAGGTCEHK